jgi:hypothetical protein
MACIFSHRMIRQKHVRAFNGALSTGCLVPGLYSKKQISFFPGCETLPNGRTPDLLAESFTDIFGWYNVSGLWIKNTHFK